MATAIKSNPHLYGRITGLLHARPMMLIELAARLDYPYPQIKGALEELVRHGDLKQMGQRYALADSEADMPNDAA